MQRDWNHDCARPSSAAVLLFGPTENGVAVCAEKVMLDDQPPTNSSVQPGLIKKRLSLTERRFIVSVERETLSNVIH